MDLAKLTKTVSDENLKLLARLDAGQVMRFVKTLQDAKRVFCGAQGRSGNILRCFCVRLMHLGYESYLVGETITPSIGKEDMAVVLSGSGHTTFTVELAKIARQQGATTCGIIGVRGSPLEKNLDAHIVLPGGSKLAKNEDLRSVQPPGSLFEQAAFLLLEAIVLELYQSQGSDRKTLLARHTNLE